MLMKYIDIDDYDSRVFVSMLLLLVPLVFFPVIHPVVHPEYTTVVLHHAPISATELYDIELILQLSSFGRCTTLLILKIIDSSPHANA
jgi:hypothetical protein